MFSEGTSGGDRPGIDQVLALIPDELAGTIWGFLAHDLIADRTILAHNQNMLFPAASLIKLPIALALYEESRQGRLHLSDTLGTDQECFAVGSGILRYLSDRAVLTLRDLVVLMLQLSDNVAANLLLKRLGRERINGLMRSLGLAHTTISVDKIFVLESDQDPFSLGTTTAYEMVRMLRLLDRHEILTPQLCGDIFAVMRRDRNKQRLCGNLPLRKDLFICHKTGTLQGAIHDVGLFSFTNGRYGVAILSQNTGTTIEAIRLGEQTIARMSRWIFDRVEQGA
jgi:beta-lactamase class A